MERGEYRESRNFLSRTLVSWLTPLLRHGYNQPLEMTDLPMVEDSEEAGSLYQAFRVAWEERRPSLKQTLFRLHGRKFMAAGFLKLLGDFGGLSSPYLLRMLIEAIEAGDKQKGYLTCALLFGSQMINCLTVNSYFRVLSLIGLRIRVGLSGAIYAKCFQVPPSTLSGNTGYIVNLQSTDVGRIETTIMFLHYLWSGPLQIVISMSLLFWLVGWSSLIGLLLFLLLIPIQSRIVQWLSAYRKVKETRLLF